MAATSSLAQGSDDQRWATTAEIFNQTAEKIRVLEQALVTKNAEIAQLHQMIQNGGGGRATTPNIDANELVSKSAMPDHLTSRSKFKSWAKKFRMLMQAKSKKIGALLKYAEAETSPIDKSNLDIATGIVDADEMNEKLYNTIQIYTEDCIEASVIVENVLDNHGIEAWRRLMVSFDPVTEHTNNHLMHKIHQPPKATVRTVLATIEAWEKLLRTYYERTKKTALTESSQKSLLLEMLPNDLAMHLTLNEHVYDTYDKMKSLIRKWVLQNTPQPMELDRLEDQDEDDDNFDIDAIAQGVKKKFAPRKSGSDSTPGNKNDPKTFPFMCYNCGEKGHKSADCKKPCGNCGQAGHISRDCPMPKKPRKTGKGSGKGDKKKNVGSLEEDQTGDDVEDMGGLDIDLCPLDDADCDINCGCGHQKIDPWSLPGSDPWAKYRPEMYRIASSMSSVNVSVESCGSCSLTNSDPRTVSTASSLESLIDSLHEMNRNFAKDDGDKIQKYSYRVATGDMDAIKTYQARVTKDGQDKIRDYLGNVTPGGNQSKKSPDMIDDKTDEDEITADGDIRNCPGMIDDKNKTDEDEITADDNIKSCPGMIDNKIGDEKMIKKYPAANIDPDYVAITNYTLADIDRTCMKYVAPDINACKYLAADLDDGLDIDTRGNCMGSLSRDREHLQVEDVACGDSHDARDTMAELIASLLRPPGLDNRSGNGVAPSAHAICRTTSLKYLSTESHKKSAFGRRRTARNDIADIDAVCDLDAIGADGDARMVEVPVDSGAVEVVAPPWFAKDYETVEGESFRAGKISGGQRRNHPK